MPHRALGVAMLAILQDHLSQFAEARGGEPTSKACIELRQRRLAEGFQKKLIVLSIVKGRRKEPAPVGGLATAAAAFCPSWCVRSRRHAGRRADQSMIGLVSHFLGEAAAGNGNSYAHARSD